MSLENIVTELNKKWSQAKEVGLTEIEKNFIKQYEPKNHFIVYGTLAPNRPNHSKIEHMKGVWHTGIVKGKLDSKGWGALLGYNGFKHCPLEEQEAIKAYVLFSNELSANWPFLDAFEGSEYRRVLAKFELDNGDVGVGYIYALNEE